MWTKLRRETLVAGVAQLLKTRADDRKVADTWFDFRTGVVPNDT